MQDFSAQSVRPYGPDQVVLGDQLLTMPHQYQQDLKGLWSASHLLPVRPGYQQPRRRGGRFESLRRTRADLAGCTLAHGKVLDLNQLVSANTALYLLTAFGIHDRGQIVGFGVSKAGELHAYLATPTGEHEEGEDD